MAEQFLTLLVDDIAAKTYAILHRKKRDLAQRIEAEKELFDPALNFGDDLKRAILFVDYIVHAVAALSVLMRQANLDQTLEYERACDEACEKALPVRNENYPAWVGGFRSSMVLRMIQDRRQIRKMLRHLIPVLFTEAGIGEMQRISDAAERFDGLTGAIRFINDLQLRSSR